LKRNELLERASQTSRRLNAALENLTEEQATQKGLNPNWSIKDCLSHIAAWEAQGARVFDEMVKGTWQPQPINREFIDGFNARAVEERGARTMREVTDEYNTAHAEIVRLLESMPEEIDEAAPGFHLIELLTIKHPLHHAAQIEEWREKQG
jgi:uncharacterized damage-inducible protein DinB